MVSLAKLPSMSIPAVQSEHYIYLNTTHPYDVPEGSILVVAELKYVASNVYPQIGPTFPSCYQVTVLTSRPYLTSRQPSL